MRVEQAGRNGLPNSLVVLAWNCGGSAPAKVEELALCIELLPSHPLVVALLETHHLLASSALSGYVVPSVAQNSEEWLASSSGSASGIYFGGVALAVDLTHAEFLCFETSLCFMAGVLRVWGLGDFVVEVVYTPPHESKHAPGKYCDGLDSLSETVRRI